MINYDIEIENAEKYNVIAFSDIYDYRSTPFEDLISLYYTFCRENLNINSRKVNISPNVLIFTNHYSSNALAKLDNGIFSISINLGLLRKCNSNFLENERLDNYIEEKFGELISPLDNKISGLGFQIATNFTYYHELAHLLQFTKRNEKNTLQERVKQTSNYDEEKHILEINADSFASIALASHITQYLEKSYNSTLNKEIAEDVITILGACLLNHIANFYSDISSIYLKDHSHPHPFLRIFNSILSLSNYLNQSEFLEERNIELNMYKIFKNILDFYEELESNKIFDTKFTDAMNNGAKIQNEISTYLGHLVEFNIPSYNNALEIWNKLLE
ncbi:hypothetical protein [Chryseobacterium flavum]|uniref:hypothetical protein n=1 Tax=Chryseobacterium flavum TaxID=415851 RepID=UPI0028A5CF46|nr:hypothetical protein [Chryseobacterium flavum]